MEKKMKTLLLVFGMIISTIAIADTYVNGYFKSNGTYVQPHYRSDADSSVSNNWSSKGNINPHTGAVGTKNPYPSVSQPIQNLYDNNKSLYEKYPGLKPR